MIRSHDVQKLRRNRRAVVLAAYGAGALSLCLALAAPGAARGPATATAPASRPLVVSPANKAAAEAQFDKANALYRQNKFAEAKVENDRALQIDPTNANALLMRQVLESRLAGTGGGGATATATAQATQTATGKIPLLTTQQVSMVRLMELGSADTRVAGRVDSRTLEDFWQNVAMKDPLGDKSKAAHDAFINPSNFVAQVRRIRDSREVKYMEQITLTTDPVSYSTYRTSVHTFVMTNCATAECHGGEKAPGGNFRLVNPANTPEQIYTNFFILSQYANGDGKMVDRASPEKSLLIQYALPWADASTRHPKVEARKLSGRTDGRINTILRWMEQLAFPKPNYNVSYEVPGEGATATAPK